MFGFSGCILRVNLTDRRISYEKLLESDARKFLGGRGLAVNILYKELKPGIEALGPYNKLVFAVGPITATNIPGDTRFVVAGKSPATGIWGEANCGGNFAGELKKAGYDAIIVEGVSQSPVYLWIKDDEVELREARHLWGKWTAETERLIQKEVNVKNAAVLSIGPAGENLVKYAAIIHKHRAAARTGLGAVMGSKKLKAIAVKGTMQVRVANQEKINKIRKRIVSYCLTNEATKLLREHGQAGFLPVINEVGLLPTMNFKRSTFDGYEKISGQTMTKTILVGRETCPGCPVVCKRIVEVKEGPFAPVLPEYGGPEYETVAALGSLLCVHNLEAIAKANMLCNAFGLDTISTGVCIAFVSECYSRGLLTKEDCDGLDLNWGNAEATIQLIPKIANREGFGDILAEGVKKVSESIRKGSKKFAMHVKGLEVPMHEPRGKKGLGLSYATSVRGACHLQSFHDTDLEIENLAPEIGLTTPLDRYDTSEEKVIAIKKTEDLIAIYNSLILCHNIYWMTYIKPIEVSEILQAVTDWEFSVTDLMITGERINNLCRCFNVREGVSREDDTLPQRFMEPLINGGPNAGQKITNEELKSMLENYYKIRGWNIKTGRPMAQKLKDLGLEFVKI